MADEKQSIIVEQAFPVDSFNCSVTPVNENDEKEKDEDKK